jgi:hypothetical protein
MLTEAYGVGREAAFNYLGKPTDQRSTRDRMCPYPAGTQQADEFRQGWDDALAEIEEGSA